MIHMQINSDNLTFLVGDINVINNAHNTPALPMFSAQAMDLLEGLSRLLLARKDIRKHQDIMSYAFWIRKSSLESAKKNHSDFQSRLGRGVAFHIAPSNVPVNFAVSMTSSLLAGNITIIRVSNKSFEAVDIICEAINELLDEKHPEMKPYLAIVRYDHSDEITIELSCICDVRIIWGGNRTIEEIRKAPLPPRAVEMAFADRHSIAIIDSKAYLKTDPIETAKKFYTDTYYTDQNACSSPRLIFWMGEAIEKAKTIFWNSLTDLVHNEYTMEPIQAVDKYTSFCELAMKDGNIKLLGDDNFISRIEVRELTTDLMNYKNGGGYFFEYSAKNLEELVPVLTKQCQTIATLGVSKEDIKELVFRSGVRGVDRIVPLGETMGLEFIWDGYKMIEQMSRFVYTGSYM